MKFFSSLLAFSLGLNVLIAGANTYHVSTNSTSGDGSLESGISNVNTSSDAINNISIDLTAAHTLAGSLTLTPSANVNSVHIFTSSNVLTVDGSSGTYSVTFNDATYPIAITTDGSLPINNADVHFNLTNPSGQSSMNFASAFGGTAHNTVIYIDPTNTSPITLTGNITGNRGIWNKSAQPGSILTLSGINTSTLNTITLDPGSNTIWNSASPPLESITNTGTLIFNQSLSTAASHSITNTGGTLKLAGGIFSGGITGGTVEFLSGTTTFRTVAHSSVAYIIDSGATMNWSFGATPLLIGSSIINSTGGFVVFTSSSQGISTGSIQNGGSLTLHSGTYQGAITDYGSAVGSVTIITTVGVTISGASTYTGLTTIQSGVLNWHSSTMPQGDFIIDSLPLGAPDGTPPYTLQFDNTGGIGLGGVYTGNITNNGMVAVNANITYTGNISGTDPRALLEIENPSLTATFSGDNSAFSGNYSTHWTAPVSAFVFTNGNIPGNNLSQININDYGSVIFTTSLNNPYEGPIIICNQSSLTLAGGTFSGAISSDYPGHGSITAASGTTVLTEADTFSGVISVASGSALTWANTNPPGVDITNNGTLTFNTAFGTYPSNIPGSGMVIMSGADNIFSGTISGSNAVEIAANTSFNGTYTYTGGTVIKNGTLTLSTGVTLPLTGGLTIDVEASLVSVYSHTMNEQVVNNGTLTAPGITVAPAANVGGSGSFNSEVICNGTLSPSGILSISGPLTLAGGSGLEGMETFTATQGSILNLNFSSLSADEVMVFDNVTISPGATVNLIEAQNPGVYPESTSFIVLETLGVGHTISGEFVPVTQNLGDHLTASLSYTPTEVLLNIVRSSLTSGVTDGNVIEIASVIDTLYNTLGNQVDSVFADLLNLSNAELQIAFSQIDPSSFKAMAIVQQQNAGAVGSALSYRLQPLLDSKHCETLCTENCSKEMKKNPLQVWFNTFGDILTQSQVTTNTTFGSYKNKTIGYVGGVDYNFAENFYIGGLGAFSDSHVKWNASSNRAGIDSYYGGLYFSAIGKMLYVNVSEIASRNVYDTHKRIVYTGMDTTAKSHHTGTQLVSHLDTGINFGFKGFSIRPFDAFDYIVQKEDGYTETGAGALDLDIKSMNAIMIRNELGVNFAKCLTFNTCRWIFDVKASWIREMRLKGGSYQSQFAGTDVEFQTEAYWPNRNLFSPGASLTGFMIEDRLSLAIYYQGAFRQGYSDNNFGGRISLNF